MNCAGGLLPNLLAPDDSKVEAAEGSVAHGVGEAWLRAKKKPRHLLNTKQEMQGYKIEIDTEMFNYVQEYVDWCSWLPGQHFVETKVYYSQITPLAVQGGTADHVACTYQKMVITDLKYGKGVLVAAKGNTQGLLYALGFFYEWDWLYDFQTIEIRICQPRMFNLDTWTITRAELLAFAEEAKSKAFAAWRIDAPRTPGLKQCAFCRVKADCAAHYHWQNEMSAGIWSDLIEPVTAEEVVALKDNIEMQRVAKFIEPHRLTTAQLAKIYPFRSMFEGWWATVHNELNIRAAAGQDVPGMKLVRGRSKRVIKDKKLALATLMLDYDLTHDELIKEVMSSPAEIEKLLRKHGHRPKDLGDILDPLVYKPMGKPTLVSDADKRDAIADLSEVAFADLILEPVNPEIEE